MDETGLKPKIVTHNIQRNIFVTLRLIRTYDIFNIYLVVKSIFIDLICLKLHNSINKRGGPEMEGFTLSGKVMS